MQFTKAQYGLLVVNSLSVIGFGSYYVQSFNYEFIAYAVLVCVVIGALYVTLHITRFPTYLIAGITLWAILHMMGGSIQTPDGVLYAYKIFPFFDGGGDFYILKMDQVVHAFLYGIVALMFLHLLRSVADVVNYPLFVIMVAIFASVGVSVTNEIIEFSATVLLPQTGVGGYENTMLDLIFNFSGAIVAVLVYTVYERKRFFQTA